MKVISTSPVSAAAAAPQPMPATPTEFDLKARRLGLTEQTYAASAQLRTWCERNKNRFYIPEWLLAEWGITVDPNVTMERSTRALTASGFS
jgi:hypothetical protein